MSLIEQYLPDYGFREVHFCVIMAKPSVVLHAAAAYQPETDPFFRKMIGLRELPMRIDARISGEQAEVAPPFGLHNFTLLEQRDDALVYGLIGRFWRLDFGLVPVGDGQAYRQFNKAGVAKLALVFSTASQGENITRLETETRVFCPDLASRLKFTPYWYLIRPVSGLIRGRILKSIKQASENS
ncbi:MAG: hypothetical protein LBE54_04080 [Brucellaceae bacterium]|jgi:hypothetical protein|nr:hypothetical protein [Brucellaceae bacterium]